MSQEKTRRSSPLPDKLSLLVVDGEAPRLFPKDSELFELFNLFITTSTVRASTIIKQNDIHIALCEEDLPDGSGSEFLVRLKQEHPSIIRILSAEDANVDTFVEAINKANVFKFIVKPWGFEMRNILEEAKQSCISRIKNQYNDNLTSLLSTAAIYDMLHNELMRTVRHKVLFSVILISITSPDADSDLHSFLVDRFLLSKIADILQNELRESDNAGRLKDNKILVLLPEADVKGTRNFLKRFIKNVETFDREINRGLLPFKILSGVKTITGEKLVTEKDLIVTLYHKLKEEKRENC